MLQLLLILGAAYLLVAAINMSHDKRDKRSELKRVQKKIAALENRKPK